MVVVRSETVYQSIRDVCLWANGSTFKLELCKKYIYIQVLFQFMLGLIYE